MLIHARQARTPNAVAPLHQRKAFASGQLRWYYGPSILLWIDAVHDRFATGATVPGLNDRSGRGVSITQMTASKQPIKSALGGVAGYTFDGVNDCLQVAAIDNSSRPALTLVHCYRKISATAGATVEASADSNFSTTGWIFAANDSGAGNDGFAFRGNVGYTFRVISGSLATWSAYAQVMDKSQALGAEMRVHRNGSQVTSFVSSLDTNNTNNFGNDAINVGSRNNGASASTNVAIAQLLLVSGALSVAEANRATLIVRQAAGAP